jgi:hypothetical protein
MELLSRNCGKQFGQPDEVVGGHGEVNRQPT